MRRRLHSLTNLWVSARAALPTIKQGSQYKSPNKPTSLKFHSQDKPGWVLAANSLSGISTVTSSHPIKKSFACQVPTARRNPRVSCRANSSVSKNICRFPVHNSIATDEIFPERQQDVLYENTYLSTGNTLEGRSPLTSVSNSVQQCSSDQQSLMWLITKPSPHAAKILGSPCLECQNRDSTSCTNSTQKTTCPSSYTPQTRAVAKINPPLCAASHGTVRNSMQLLGAGGLL